MPNFTTGPATLPDVGELSYNKCTFSPLFASQVSCAYVKDEAKRVTKEIEYTITVDGYVTLPDGAQNIEESFLTLERLLSAPAGPLVYNGRGLKIAVNTAGGDKDTAWGPLPEVLDITPMGGGRSAHVVWTVKTRVPPRVPRSTSRTGPVLQFNYETSVSYDDAGYSTLTVRGVTEVPLTRNLSTDRSVTSTADDFRASFPGTLLSTIDLRLFKIASRNFTLSRDKRTLTFEVVAKEHSWMVNPPDVTVARGQFNFRPVKQGAGLVNWLCTLSCTYKVPANKPRGRAWFAFLALLRLRMKFGDIFGQVPPPPGNQNPAINPAAAALVVAGNQIGPANFLWRNVFNRNEAPARQRKVILVDLSGTEGLYEDGATVTFSATWRLATVFSSILLASGLWRKVPAFNNNTWATSVAAISGHTSWLTNRADPSKDALVDFGF